MSTNCSHVSCDTVQVWKRTDIILTSCAEYANPYRDVDLFADFTHEDGTKIPLRGFWNGGNEFRVRFAPIKTGVWTYEISCSNPDDSGLNGQSGTITAVENTGSTELDKHGFVRISDNSRYFVYDDGTPFYWLGDTNWQAPNYVSIKKCNYPGCTCGSQFMHELNDRTAKGFTVYQTYFDMAECDGGGQRDTCEEPSFWAIPKKLIDPQTFTAKIDFMFDTLADRGMTIALGYGVHSATTSLISTEDLDRVSAYLTARYASYPIVWITAQEITGEPQFAPWVSSARIVAEYDGYNHPQGAHQFPMGCDNPFIEALDRESWHDFYVLQSGHGPIYQPKEMFKGYWDNRRSGKIKPLVETEANYEDVSCGGFNGYDGSRIAGWRVNFLGSYGFTYGTTGIWANCYSTAGCTGWLGSYSFEPWYMGIDKPGAYEVMYMADFFRYADFSTLVPRFNDPDYSDITAEDKLVSSSDDGRTYAAYFCNADLSTCVLKKLDPNAVYTVKWYNPITGKFVEAGTAEVSSDGTYALPEKPNKKDWAVLITSRTDLGEYRTESLFDTSALPEEAYSFRGKPVIPAVTCSGCCIYAADGTKTDTRSALFDNDPSAEWVPFAPWSTQTITLDLGEEKNVYGIRITLGKDAVLPPYRIEGTNDGFDHTVLADSALRDPRIGENNDLRVITEPLSGKYRYIRVLWLNCETNKDIKTISGMELYAD